VEHHEKEAETQRGLTYLNPYDVILVEYIPVTVLQKLAKQVSEAANNSEFVWL
jgi:hypothetical protein